MQVGLGVLGLTPDQFWKLTLPELNAKVEGFREFHGVKTKPKLPTRADLAVALEAFPDGPLPKDLWLRHKRNLRERELN